MPSSESISPNAQAIAILQKRERSEEDLYLLRTLLRQIQFFKDRSMNDEDLLDVASCMKLEVKEKGEDIIRIGQRGYSFYVILQGQCGVFLPQNTKNQKKASEVTSDREDSPISPKTNLNQSRPITSFRLLSPKGEQRSHLKRAFTKQGRQNGGIERSSTQALGDSTKDIDRTRQLRLPAVVARKETDKKLRSRLASKEESFRSIEFEEKDLILEDDQEQSKEKDGLVLVSTLNEGQPFGELALLRNKGRAATVRCMSEQAFLGIIERNDYKKVLSRIEQKRIDKTVDFLAGLPPFVHWAPLLLTKLQYFFEAQQYRRKQRVFNQGEEANHIFVIRSGEFSVVASIQQTKE